ncbi:hypothetical protein ACTA71_007203 [Dictyostelium dimigraforme]
MNTILNGVCSCPNSRSRIDCTIPYHTISEISPGDINNGITLIYDSIGDQPCYPIEISCKSLTGIGLKSVTIIQNLIDVRAKDIYLYYSNDKVCPNDYTSTWYNINMMNRPTNYQLLISKLLEIDFN